MSHVGEVRSIVLECGDPERLAAFWSAVLGADIDQRQDDWWSLDRPAGGPRLAFQVVPDYQPPQWPGRSGEQQIHLDVEVADLATGARQVLALGAHTLSEVVEPGPGEWQVFVDPAGHPFCLVT